MSHIPPPHSRIWNADFAPPPALTPQKPDPNRTSSKRRSIALTVLFLLLICPLVASAQGLNLPKTITTNLDKLIANYEQGDGPALVELAASILQRADEKRVEQINTYLIQKGQPPIEEMLVETRIALSRPGVNVKVPAPGNKEAIFLAAEILRQADLIDANFQKHKLLKGEVVAPAKYEEYDNLFWELHVIRNQLTNAIELTRTIGNIIEKRKGRLEKLASATQKKTLQHDFLARSKQIEKLLMDVEEREAFLRIFRLNETIAMDEGPLTEKEKFVVSYNASTDVSYLETFFKEFDGTQFTRGDLNDTALLTSISEDSLKIREKYKDKIEKGELLFQGLHWWFRGRYGAGPLAQGLLKAPGAHLNEKALFPLMMPQAKPLPNDPYQDNYKIPHFERRHHYVWQIQQETVQRYQKPPLRKITRSTSSDIPEGGKEFKKFY